MNADKAVTCAPVDATHATCRAVKGIEFSVMLRILMNDVVNHVTYRATDDATRDATLLAVHRA